MPNIYIMTIHSQLMNRHSRPKSSIKREIFQSSALLALIVVAVFGFFISTILYYSEISKARAVIMRTNHAAVIFIEGYFTEIINTIAVLDENKEIRDAMALNEEARQRILDGYRSIAKVNKNITYIYSGYPNGLMLINDYTPPEGFDPTTRPWYRAAMAAKHETSIGLPYQEIKTKEWLISTSRALKQPGGGYAGVIAIDCSIDQIARLLEPHDEYKTAFSFVMDRSTKIILHPDPSFLGKSLQEITESSPQAGEGDATYRMDHLERFAHFSRVPSTGWTVVTLVDKREILRPIISQVLSFLGLTGVIAVFLGLVQSILLSRRLSRPLVELGRKIKAIIAGDEPDVDKYVYPNNEIGIMAWEIGQLAEKELNAKTRELQASEEKHRLLIEHAVSAVAVHEIVLDEAGRPVDYVFLSANPAFETHTGLQVADILGRRVTEVMPGIEKPPFIEIYGKVVLTGESVSLEQYSEPLGRHFFINAYRVGEGRFATIFIDITDRKQAEEALRESEYTYRTTMEQMYDPYVEIDLAGNFTFVNESICRHLGYAREELIGKNFSLIIPADEKKAIFIAYKKALESGVPNKGYSHRVVKKDGSILFAEASIDMRRNRQGEIIGFRTISRDITERKKMEAEILALSITDPLTGLHNRRGFLSLAGQQLKLSTRNKSGALLFFVDLDGLKRINDTMGHEEGDKALIEAATVLKETFRASDIIARLGGDEYAALTVDIPEENSEIFTARLQSLIDTRNNQENGRYRLSISVGCAYYDPEYPCSIHELMASADKLMYEQKQNKKGLLLQGASLSYGYLQ